MEETYGILENTHCLAYIPAIQIYNEQNKTKQKLYNENL